MKEAWLFWIQKHFSAESSELKYPSIRILGNESSSKVHANIRDNGNLEGIGIYSTSDKWSGFYIVMDFSVNHSIKIVQDSIYTDYGDNDWPFNDVNKKSVLTFLKNVLREGWTETTFYYNGDPFKIQFSFGKNRGIEISEFIYPLAEIDYPLFGTKIYNFYYLFIMKFASKRISKQELVVKGLTITEPKDEG